MALEFQKLEVASNEMDRWVEWMAHFGWNLKSSQRVMNRNIRPVGAISYENLTYIHSQTEVVDFTELLFERDKSIPNYYEICELEQEALAILPDCTALRPLDLPPELSFEEWFDKNKPTLGHAILTGVLIFIGYLIGFFLLKHVWNEYLCHIVIFSHINDSLINILWSFLGGFELSTERELLIIVNILRLKDLVIHLAAILLILRHNVKLFKLPAENSKFYNKKQSEYNLYQNLRTRQQEHIQRYEYAYKRIREIISEASELI